MRLCILIVLGWSCWAALLISNATANAAEDYRCHIDRVALIGGDSGPRYKMYVDEFVGREFTVSRPSGDMAGALTNAYSRKPEVVDYGGEGNSYKVVTVMNRSEGAGAGSYVSVLTVQEYVESPKKPFGYFNHDGVFLGYCEHF